MKEPVDPSEKASPAGPHRRRPQATNTGLSTSVPALSKVLDDSRPAIEAGLQEAERELAALNERRRELEALIVRARAALRELDPSAAASGQQQRLTLHEAMELVLTEHPSHAMSVRDLAREINERELYVKRDRSPVEPNQIHARASSKTYADRFEKKDGTVTLRRGSR